jgi:hypothetical protein
MFKIAVNMSNTSRRSRECCFVSIAVLLLCLTLPVQVDSQRKPPEPIARPKQSTTNSELTKKQDSQPLPGREQSAADSQLTKTKQSEQANRQLQVATDSELTKALSEKGPQLTKPDRARPHALSVQGFVKGGWPMIFDYELEQSGIVLIEVTRDNVEPFYYRVEGYRTGRRQEIVRLPPRFGGIAVPARFTIRALGDNLGVVKPIRLRVYAFGAGDKAVGSVGIDELQFKPEKINPAFNQIANYQFLPRYDFSSAVVEFNSIQEFPDGHLESTTVNQQSFENVISGKTVEGKWNGRDPLGQVVNGLYQLQVRAWMNYMAGDWVAAWSYQFVLVSA